MDCTLIYEGSPSGQITWFHVAKDGSRETPAEVFYDGELGRSFWLMPDGRVYGENGRMDDWCCPLHGWWGHHCWCGTVERLRASSGS